MSARNPRILSAGGQIPTVVSEGLGVTGKLIVQGPLANVNLLVKQIILSNSGTSANVVHLYLDTTTTVSLVERIIETSVAADSTTILYVNIPMVDTTLDMYANCTTSGEVNITVIGDIEAV